MFHITLLCLFAHLLSLLFGIMGFHQLDITIDFGMCIGYTSFTSVSTCKEVGIFGNEQLIVPDNLREKGARNVNNST